ncbi:cell division protein [Winogradskyella sp. R77965]|uniref:cell division protein n=1 Tax=Winogradskyella sp. R77965 TaxID=3093872 RepID=UPI0037DD9D66
MPLITVKTKIDADINVCFDLARDIGFYYKSLKKFTEIPIRGKTFGLVEKGDYTTWETNHLIFAQHLILRVTEFESPYLFVDEMVKGEFKAYRHEHVFKEDSNKTVMIDKFYFESPYGVLGQIVDWLFLKRHLKRLLITRNALLKQKAENRS